MTTAELERLLKSNGCEIRGHEVITRSTIDGGAR